MAGAADTRVSSVLRAGTHPLAASPDITVFPPAPPGLDVATPDPASGATGRRAASPVPSQRSHTSTSTLPLADARLHP